MISPFYQSFARCFQRMLVACHFFLVISNCQVAQLWQQPEERQSRRSKRFLPTTRVHLRFAGRFLDESAIGPSQHSGHPTSDVHMLMGSWNLLLFCKNGKCIHLSLKRFTFLCPCLLWLPVWIIIIMKSPQYGCLLPNLGLQQKISEGTR